MKVEIRWCDPETVPFYERMGMRPAGGMMIRHYDKQSGAKL
jgi:hypothetical protein